MFSRCFHGNLQAAGGELSFEEMKLPQLKEELAARGSKRSGLKGSLQRRLHGLLVQAAIATHAAEEAEAGAPNADGDAPEPARTVRSVRGGEVRELSLIHI